MSLLALLASAPIGAQESGGEGPRRCISLSSIDRTEIIDNRTIAFYVTGGRIYLNRLDRACRNLGRDRPFSYETPTGQLCAGDTITVIEDFGFGVSAGDSCGLGAFVPTEEEEIEILKGEREPVEVEVEEVEVEVEDPARPSRTSAEGLRTEGEGHPSAEGLSAPPVSLSSSRMSSGR
jgi:hypothetical protein